MPFRPGEHAKSRDLEPVYEDVPAHLRQQLWGWTSSLLQSDASISAVANHMRFDFEVTRNLSGFSNPYMNMREFIERACIAEPEIQLRVVEFLLSVHGSASREGRSAYLEEHLRVGNSAYSVSEDGKRLEMRTTPEVRDQVAATVHSAPGSPGEHLAAAWNGGYGRQSDPVRSYSESVKAAEAALAQRVSPQNGRQTLGTMIRDVAAKPGKWEFVIADGNVGGVETVLHMMQMLWDGQTSRHGGVGPTRPETVDEARAAVHIAAALVQWGVSGSFRRR